MKNKIQKKEISTIKVIIFMLLLTSTLWFIMQAIYSIWESSWLLPDEHMTKAEEIYYQYFSASILCWIILVFDSFISIIISYKIIFRKRKLINENHLKYILIFLEIFFLIQAYLHIFSTDILWIYSQGYIGLFTEIFLPLMIGIILTFCIILCFVVYKKTKLHRKIIPLTILIIGIIIIIFGIYRINNNFNIEYIEDYIINNE